MDLASVLAGLPENPRISQVVELWKGLTKYAGMAAIGFAAAFAFVHATIARRNEVSRAEDREAEHLIDEEAARGRQA